MFRVRVAVRSYETDQLGHLNQAVYAAWAEHARVELVRSAGVALPGPENLGVVVLEATIRYLKELRVGDEVDVSCGIVFGAGRTFAMDSSFVRTDGVVCAEVHTTMGLMDLGVRRLVAEPRRRLSALATRPEVWEHASSSDDAPERS